jgi:hypothetical protein
MKLVMALLVRDEADIVSSNVDFDLDDQRTSLSPRRICRSTAPPTFRAPATVAGFFSTSATRTTITPITRSLATVGDRGVDERQVSERRSKSYIGVDRKGPCDDRRFRLAR